MEYDIAIIGAGISGLMLAYRLLEKEQETRIIILDKGKKLENRKCPIIEEKSEKCVECNTCSIMNGIAGAGAFSDGKFIISTEYGGNLQEKIGDEEARKYMEIANSILEKYGATKSYFELDKEIISKCKRNNLIIKKGIVKHFGTEKNLEIMKKLIEKVEKKCKIQSEFDVIDVNIDNKTIKIESKDEKIKAKKVVFAVGRSGSKFLKNWCEKNDIGTTNSNVDIGVRVELKSEVWKEISSIIYDPKISYKSIKYGDETRVFCFNEGGHVVMENNSNIKTVNGHAYSDINKKSENSNFALLTSIKFTEPFNDPIEYVQSFANCVNKISGNSVIVQRFGDLVKGCRTTKEKLEKSAVRPTLEIAYPGDLSLCLPKRQLDNIIEMIEKLNSIAPGTSNEDTLLYGMEGKYYSSIPIMNDFLIGKSKKIYVCGDGCGVTRSLAQAAANGLYIADKILNRKN